MNDFKHEDGTKCDGGFHCPRCGGHHFGTDSTIDGSENWIVHCNGEYGGCNWSGPYRDHVSND
jgi:hypothetical protein